jgi:lysophospholipase L1-like esterase
MVKWGGFLFLICIVLVSGCASQGDVLIKRNVSNDYNGADFNMIQIDINQFDINYIDINHFDINYFQTDVNQYDINQFFISDLNDTNYELAGIMYGPRDGNGWRIDINANDHNVNIVQDVNANRYCFRNNGCISSWHDVNQGTGGTGTGSVDINSYSHWIGDIGTTSADRNNDTMNIIGAGGITTTVLNDQIIINAGLFPVQLDTNVWTSHWLESDNNNLRNDWNAYKNIKVFDLNVVRAVDVGASNNNIKSGPRIVAGNGNVIDCNYCGVFGTLNTATNIRSSILIGSSNTILSMQDSIVSGRNLSINVDSSVISGYSGLITGSNILGAMGGAAASTVSGNNLIVGMGSGVATAIATNNSTVLNDMNLCLTGNGIFNSAQFPDGNCIDSWTDINALMISSTGDFLPLAGGTVTGDTNFEHGLSISLGESDHNEGLYVRVAGKEPPIAGVATGTGLATSWEAINLERTTRLRQDGNLNGIEIYFGSLLGTTSLKVTVWRKEGATYDKIGESEELISAIGVGVNIIHFTSPIPNVQEGDFIGFKVRAAGTGQKQFNLTDGNQGTYYVASFADWRNFDWDVLGSPLSGTGYIRVFGLSYSPTVIFIGDSRFSGYENSWTFQGTTSFWETQNNLNSGQNRNVPWIVGHALNVPYQNVAQGGEKISLPTTYGPGFVNRWEESVNQAHPKLVVMQGGVNDVVQGVSTEGLTGALNQMLNWADENGIATLVVLIEPSMLSDGNAAYIDGNNSAIRNMIDINHPNTKVCDSKYYIGLERTSGPPGNRWSIIPDYNGDGLHFNYEGNRRIAQCVLDALGKLRVYGEAEVGQIELHGDIEITGNNQKEIKVGRATNPNVRPDLVIQAGGADLNGQNKDGGVLVLKSGIPTGTGGSLIALQTPNITSSLDANKDNNTYYTRMFVSGNGITIGDTAASRASAWNPLFMKCTDATCIKMASTQTSAMSGIARVLDQGLLIMDGLDYNQGAFYARSTEEVHMALGDNGLFGIYNATGLTPGALVPTTNLRLLIDQNGLVSATTTNRSSLGFGSGAGGNYTSFLNETMTGSSLMGHAVLYEPPLTIRALKSDTEQMLMANGNTRFYGDNGLVVGNPFVGTERLAILATGQLTVNQAYSLPATDGTARQTLKTDGAGTLTWKDTNDHAEATFWDNNRLIFPAYLSYQGITNAAGTTGFNPPYAFDITAISMGGKIAGNAGASVDCNAYKNGVTTAATARLIVNAAQQKTVTYSKVAGLANDRLNVYCARNGVIVNAEYLTVTITINYT